MNDNTINPSILNLAAQKLFYDAAQKLEQSKSSESYPLSEEQLECLASKILLLPDDWQEALLLHYGCGFDSELVSDILEMDNAKGNILYAKDTLACSIGVADMADKSITAACHIALKQLRTQIKEPQLAEQHISISKNFDKKMRRLFCRQVNAVYMDFLTIAKRVAIILLAILITSTITVFSVEALRNRFFDWWFSVFPTHTRVEFYNVEQIYGKDNYEALKQYNLPAYIPESFTLTETVEAGNYYKLIFQDDSDGWIIFDIQIVHEGANVNLNTENAEMESIRINGSEGFYIYNDGVHTITWSNANAYFRLSCNLSKSEALEIANSTKIK